MEFTNKWFERQAETLVKYFRQTPNTSLHILEIGAFEGAGTVWFAEKLTHPKSTLTVVDPFSSEDEVTPVNEEVFERWKRNVVRGPNAAKINLRREKSSAALVKLISEGALFDFISVDGSHLAEDVLFDAVVGWSLLKVGGLMWFDDYGSEPIGFAREAVDSFLLCHDRSNHTVKPPITGGDCRVIYRGYELLIEKVEPWIVLAEHIDTAITSAIRGESKLTSEILALDGMSSSRGRALLNNLVALHSGRYLEIGTWKGSTFVSALYGNNVSCAVSIDDWSEFGGPKAEFKANCDAFLGGTNLVHYDHDCFTVELEEKFDIIFYDGWHDVLEQEKALTYFERNMASTCIFIVDDWNWASVKAGTAAGLEKLTTHRVAREWCLECSECDRDSWWNGTKIILLVSV